MKQAFSSSPSTKGTKESIAEVNRRYKEYTEVAPPPPRYLNQAAPVTRWQCGRLQNEVGQERTGAAAMLHPAVLPSGSCVTCLCLIFAFFRRT